MLNASPFIVYKFNGFNIRANKQENKRRNTIIINTGLLNQLDYPDCVFLCRVPVAGCRSQFSSYIICINAIVSCTIKHLASKTFKTGPKIHFSFQFINFVFIVENIFLKWSRSRNHEPKRLIVHCITLFSLLFQWNSPNALSNGTGRIYCPSTDDTWI